MSIAEEALQKHEQWQGKIEVISRVPVTNKEELSLAYTPGVAAPCLAIQKDESLAYSLTRKWNLVAVVTDGTAVLGLGDIGPQAAMPVMEGKCALFKAFADVDAFPLCVDSKDTDTIVETVRLISKSFGGINLEDIAAPRCFEIERRLKEVCDIPVFHDDQHGTAVVVLAGVLNALRLAKKEIGQIRAVVNGAGSAGIAVAKLLLACGLKNLTLCDRFGAIYPGAPGNNPAQEEMAQVTNPEGLKGTLGQVIQGMDLFVGVSAPNILTQEMVASMAKDAILFAMANPVPEIDPALAKQAGALVVGTGRSDYANQINNVLAFPGIFRGALDVRARDINDAMKLAAAHAIADMVSDEELSPEYVIPAPFDQRVGPAVARAVAQAAIDSGLARL